MSLKEDWAELEILRLGRDRISDGNVRGTADVRRFGDTVRAGCNYIGRRMLRLVLPGRRPRGRPKRYIDMSMMLVGVREEYAQVEMDDSLWRLLKETLRLRP